MRFLPVLSPPAVLLASPSATVVQDGVLAIVLLAAEALAWFGAISEAALARFSRSALIEGTEPEFREGLERSLKRQPTYELTAQLARYLGNSLLVLGLGYVVFRGRLGGEENLPAGALAAVVGIAFALTFLVNDVLARVLAERAPERIVRRTLPTLEVLARISAPIRAPLRWLVRAIFRLRLEEAPATAREEVRESLEEGAREGTISHEEREMIGSIIDLPTSRVEDVMTPRATMVSIDENATFEEAITRVNEDGYSRIPVYRGDRDEIVGILYARDLLMAWRPAHPPTLARGRTDAGDGPRVRDLMREPTFVPIGKSVSDLLQEMRARKVHIAVVLDENVKVAGVVTIEDLLEEIVGDIQDEHDEEELPDASVPAPVRMPDGSMQFDGRTSLEDFDKSVETTLNESDAYATVGGLVFHGLGKVPEPGDRLEFEGWAFTVLDADERTVRTVAVERLAAADGSERA